MTHDSSALPEVFLSFNTEDDRWNDKLPFLEEKGLSAAKKVFDLPEIKKHLLPRSVEISVCLTNDDAIHLLNKQYRGKDSATNVLSFETDESAKAEEFGLLGDIVLSYETLSCQAEEEKISFEDHFIHLFIHGLLHLLGYDHEKSEEEAEFMEQMETQILASFGIKNPYADACSLENKE